MRQVPIANTFSAWRTTARELLAAKVPPSDVTWTDDQQTPLLPMPAAQETTAATSNARVPKEFLQLAQVVACHRDPIRWPLLYRTLWRLTRGEHNLLEIVTDDDTHALFQMEKAVRRDRHKMTAFVRFKELQCDGDTHYVAWYEPAHYVLRLAADHFRERYRVMKWSILTPDECCDWDGQKLRFTPGVTRDHAPAEDELEALWLTYYGSIFNPARIKLNAMRKEMPVKFWQHLPETKIIPDLLQQAPSRVAEMVRRSASLAAEVNMTSVPETNSLKVLREAACACTRCDLYKPATQTVFGEGLPKARVVFVGEQPGDQEDLAGKPFIGPAGKMFDDILQEVGIDRSTVYVTNAVKHFKFEPRGKRRIHAKPNAKEMAACHVWVEKELQIIKPKMLVLLGATAAQSLIGRTFRITKQRGQVFESNWSPWTLATYHPSALLRAPDERLRQAMIDDFRSDLEQVAKQIATLH